MLATADTIYLIAFTAVDTIAFLIFEVYIAIFLGETAVFKIDVTRYYILLLPDTYEIEYDKEMARFNYTGNRFDAWLYHKRVCKYWDLENLNLAEELIKYEHICS